MTRLLILIATAVLAFVEPRSPKLVTVVPRAAEASTTTRPAIPFEDPDLKWHEDPKCAFEASSCGCGAQ